MDAAGTCLKLIAAGRRNGSCHGGSGRQEEWPRTVAEFEAWHARQPERREFIRGQPRMMAPASLRHSIIKRNAFRVLDRALEGRSCEALVDGPQILTDEISAIPDVVVPCAQLDLTTRRSPSP